MKKHIGSWYFLARKNSDFKFWFVFIMYFILFLQRNWFRYKKRRGIGSSWDDPDTRCSRCASYCWICRNSRIQVNIFTTSVQRFVGFSMMRQTLSTFLRSRRKPRVAVLSTGNELQPPEEPLKPGKIRDSNKTALLTLLDERGFPACDSGIAVDEFVHS